LETQILGKQIGKNGVKIINNEECARGIEEKLDI
jgi:hypothetical protein